MLVLAGRGKMRFAFRGGVSERFVTPH